MKVATFKLHGLIEDSDPMEIIFFGEEVTERVNLKTVEDFIQANQDADELHIEINSPGGSMDVGFQIHDALVSSGKKISTEITGNCFSIATAVLLAAKKEDRSMRENAQSLLHNPWLGIDGAFEAKDFQKLADEMNAHQDKLKNFYVEKLSVTPEKVTEYMEADKIIHSAEALELGLVGSIINTNTQASKTKAYAFFNSKIKPKNNMATFEERMKADLTGIKKFLAGAKAQIKNFVHTDDSGATLFTTEKETDEIIVGDPATPDGTFVLPDGRTVVITGGKIESITEAEDNEIENLKSENASLKAELETLKASSEENTKALAEATAMLKETAEIMASMKSKGSPSGRVNTQKAEDSKQEPTVKQEKAALAKKLADLREKKTKK